MFPNGFGCAGSFSGFFASGYENYLAMPLPPYKKNNIPYFLQRPKNKKRK